MRILDESCLRNARVHMKKLILIGALILVSTALISIIGCAAQETTREGYKTYSKYGFSFEYPESFLAFEQGLLESQANDTSGMVVVAIENEEIKCASVGWLKTQESLVDLEGGIEGAFEATEADETLINLERGELVETTKEGHRILYQYYAETYSDIGEVFGIFGNWYCDKSQIFFSLMTINSTISSKEDVLTDYLDYLDNFVCH